ncbi:MAG: 50S ribosomal protein L23 [Candidatus Gracilibacteria bacterium]|jgi:large subunit ribosomal protein L23
MKTFDVLLRPVVTEKATSGEKEGKYQFFVSKDATKVDIKDAFNKVYGVKAIKVNVINTAGKTKIGAGRREVPKKAALKKVVITTASKKTLDVLKPKLKI